MTGNLSRARELGFTLIEMLVTVTLLAVLCLLVFGGVRFGARAWEGSQSHGAGSDELRVVQDLLRREMEAVYPYYDASDPVHPFIEFEGDANAVSFLGPAPQAAQTPGRARVSIVRERDGQYWQVAMRAVPELAASTRGAWSVSLLRHLAAIRFSYYGDGGWRSDWGRQAAIPGLIRLHVEFPHGDGRVWPDLVVAPHIQADANCQLDYLTKRCRGRS
jgi:general secretion pathway protein J